jgi:hypothetical protein
MQGTKFGPAVIPGKPDQSNPVMLINGPAGTRMPFKHRPLPNCLRQDIGTWIFQGARQLIRCIRTIDGAAFAVAPVIVCARHLDVVARCGVDDGVRPFAVTTGAVRPHL